jgi:tripartite-type tricarboxylate transporter receptor subunit TctC
MRSARLLYRAAIIVVIAAAMTFAHAAENYPTRPIRMLTGEAGGGGDFAARLIAQELSVYLGERVVVDNRGLISAEIAARATPDGYTLLLYGSPLWVSPLLREARYDVQRDLAPISEVVTVPNLLVVNPALPVTSVTELVKLAKSKPGTLNYSAGSVGSTQHLAAELFKTMAGVNIVRVTYKGAGPAIMGTVVGETQLMFPTAGSAAAHVKAGRLRALAVTSAQPSALAPGLPTVSASGIPGYESESPFGIFAPARTPAAVIVRLNRELVRLLHEREMQERFFSTGVEAVGSTPEALSALIRKETEKWRRVIKQSGLGG